MYKVQRQGKWEVCEGRLVAVGETALTVEDGEGIRATILIASVQGWVYDPTPARTVQEPVTMSLSEEVEEPLTEA
jgi:hypothetical protein